MVRKLAWGLAVVGVLACAPSALRYLESGCWDCALYSGHHHCSIERNASATLKSFASAQADFRGNDRDVDGIQQFWRGDVAGLAPAGTFWPGTQSTRAHQ